ncbi:MAG TPA: DUF2306 domain-containing protein, partial [Sphingomicrobium sp.]
PAQGRGDGLSAIALRWTAALLVTAAWISGAIFGLYILLFFGGTAFGGAVDRWNESLPGLHRAGASLATGAIGMHFAAGGILLVLGPIQLMGRIRRAVPAIHRWLGRLYVVLAGLAGLGGLTFILSNGTIGGPVMSLGFGLYGALMVTASVTAYSYARARRFERHRAWAIRLFALTVGSWLYRIEYGFWFMAIGKIGHDPTFHSWFDHVMVFFFYLPNLAVAELFIRARTGQLGKATARSAAAVLLACSLFVITATWFFTADFWGPGMVSGITGTSL